MKLTETLVVIDDDEIEGIVYGFQILAEKSETSEVYARLKHLGRHIRVLSLMRDDTSKPVACERIEGEVNMTLLIRDAALALMYDVLTTPSAATPCRIEAACKLVPFVFEIDAQEAAN